MSETISTDVTENYYYHDAASKPVKPEYEIAFGYSLGEVESAVRKMLADGWLPQGGVCVALGGEDFRLYSQAMVRGVGR